MPSLSNLIGAAVNGVVLIIAILAALIVRILTIAILIVIRGLITVLIDAIIPNLIGARVDGKSVGLTVAIFVRTCVITIGACIVVGFITIAIGIIVRCTIAGSMPSYQISSASGLTLRRHRCSLPLRQIHRHPHLFLLEHPYQWSHLHNLHPHQSTVR